MKIINMINSVNLLNPQIIILYILWNCFWIFSFSLIWDFFKNKKAAKWEKNNYLEMNHYLFINYIDELLRLKEGINNSTCYSLILLMNKEIIEEKKYVLERLEKRTNSIRSLILNNFRIREKLKEKYLKEIKEDYNRISTIISLLK